MPIFYYYPGSVNVRVCNCAGRRMNTVTLNATTMQAFSTIRDPAATGLSPPFQGVLAIEQHQLVVDRCRLQA